MDSLGFAPLPTDEIVFKIFLPDQFLQFEQQGEFRGSPDDERDGYIHLSRAHQVRGTIKKHFYDRDDLVIVAFKTDLLSNTLRWEPSRGGQLFPHLYGTMKFAHTYRTTTVQQWFSEFKDEA